MSGFILSSYWAMLSYLHTSKKITSPSRDIVHMHLQPFKHMQLHLKNKQKPNKQPVSTAPSGKKNQSNIYECFTIFVQLPSCKKTHPGCPGEEPSVPKIAASSTGGHAVSIAPSSRSHLTDVTGPGV